jgi:hypothetical protein
MILMGVAIGCKYTAVLLCVVYIGKEIHDGLATAQPRIPVDISGNNILVPRYILLSICILAATAAVTLAMFFPTAWVLKFVTQVRTNVNLRSPDEYRAFFWSFAREAGH